MADRIITIKFTGNTKSLIASVAEANAALDAVGKKSPALDKLARSLENTATSAKKTEPGSKAVKELSKNLESLSKPGDQLLKVGRNLALVETAITTVAKVGTYLKPMIGLIGLIPGAVAVAGAAFGVLKLGSAGIAAAFKGVGDSAKKSVSDVFQKELAPAAKSVSSLLRDLTPGLKGVASEMSSVGVAVTKTAANADNVKSLNTVLGATKEVVGNLGGAFGPLISAFLTIASIAAPIFAKLTAGATGWATKLQEKVQALAADGRLAAWIQKGIARFDDFKNRIVKFVKDIEPIAKNLGGIRLQLFDGIGPALIPALTAISAFLEKHPNLALWIIGVGAAFKILAPTIMAVSLAMKLFEADPIVLIIIAIAIAIAALVAGFVYLWNTSEGFRNFWTGLWNGIMVAVSAVVSWFQSTALPFLTGVWDGIVGAARVAFAWFTANLLPIFQQVWKGIQDAVNSFLQWANANIVPWFNQVSGQIGDAVKAIRQVWNDLWGGDFGKIVSAAFDILLPIIKVALQVIGDIFGGVFNAIIDVLKGAWDIISGVISGALQIIKGIFEVFGGLLTGNWSQVWHGLGDIVGGAGTIIMGIVHGIGQVLAGLRDIAVGVGHAIGDAFSGLGGILRSALNGLISIANTGIHAVNAVTGVVGIGPIGDIPHLAKGGIANANQMYLVGENGPELFTPGRTGRVTPADQTADLMGGSNVSGDIVFQVDGEVFARIARGEILTANRKLRADVRAGR